MGLGTGTKAGRDFLIDQLIQFLQLQMGLPDAYRLHPAADVHPHQIGYHFVGDGHGGANGAARSGVNIRASDGCGCPP